jgi:hypothetical protein
MSTLDLVKTAVERKKIMLKAAQTLKEKHPELLESEPELEAFVKLLDKL